MACFEQEGESEKHLFLKCVSYVCQPYDRLSYLEGGAERGALPLGKRPPSATAPPPTHHPIEKGKGSVKDSTLIRVIVSRRSVQGGADATHRWCHPASCDAGPACPSPWNQVNRLPEISGG